MEKGSEPVQVEPIDDWKADVASEKSFSAVIASSWGVVGSPRDLWLSAAVFLASAGGILIAYWCGTLAQASDTARLVQVWASLLANMVVAILGFLIAGFSVFATITRPELFRFMAQYRLKERKISEFKFVFYNFLYIFFHYILFLSICLLGATLTAPHTPAWYFAILAQDRWGADFIDILAAIAAAVLSAYALFALLLLKSFLWNLYQTLVFAIFVKIPAEAEPTPSEPGQNK